MINMGDNLFGNVAWSSDKPRSGVVTLANGKTAKVEFDIDEAEKKSAQNTFNLLIANEPQVRRKVAVLLLRNFADWIPGDLTAPEPLAARIDLSDILLWEGGGGQLYYYANGDDDLFTSHAICVWFDANGEIDEVELAG